MATTSIFRCLSRLKNGAQGTATSGGAAPATVISPAASICAATAGGEPVSMSRPMPHAGMPRVWRSTTQVAFLPPARPLTMARTTSYWSSRPTRLAGRWLIATLLATSMGLTWTPADVDEARSRPCRGRAGTSPGR